MKLLGTVILLAIVAVVVASAPDAKRYNKIRKM